MISTFVLSDYLEQALSQAEYDKLEDGSFPGRIAGCMGVIAFSASFRECENEFRSTLEDWVLVGLNLGHELPILGSLNLNLLPPHESVEAV